MIVSEPPNQMRCDIHTNWMVGKSGKCGRKEMCKEHLDPKCGEQVFYVERLRFLEKVKTLKVSK